MFVYILRNGNCDGLMLHILIFNNIIKKFMFSILCILAFEDCSHSCKEKKSLRFAFDVHESVYHDIIWKQPPRCNYKGGYTLVTLPRIVTPYRDSVNGTRDRVTYQKLVTR
jgi:hypothetical protein